MKIPDNVPSPFKKHFFYKPHIKKETPKSRPKERIPTIVSGKSYQEYLKKKLKQKEDLEHIKVEKAAEKLKKKKEKESSKRIKTLTKLESTKIKQLLKINDGLNFFYNLLSHDVEAYRENFLKDVTHLYVCWECKAVIVKQVNFKQQVCTAQKRLIFNGGKISIRSLGRCLSKLSTYYDKPNSHTTNIDMERLAVLHSSGLDKSDQSVYASENWMKRELKLNHKDVKMEFHPEKTIECEERTEFYTILKSSVNEIQMHKAEKRLSSHFRKTSIHCEFCVQIFKDNKSLRRHNETTHTERRNYSYCNECGNYVKSSQFDVHKLDHIRYYRCNLCKEVIFLRKILKQHLLVMHKKKPPNLWIRKTPLIKNPGSKPRMNQALRDAATPRGYACPECDLFFQNKKVRYKHIQSCHRAGFKCNECDKIFRFKTSLKKHQLIHSGLVKREQCTKCGKVIRAECMNVHNQTHAHSSLRFECVPCDKRFSSRASYEHHFKYTKAHATRDIYKYKCDYCGKGYRAKSELKDHINFVHMGKTQHYCSICKKPVASKRILKRHIRLMHGSKEVDNVKCQICQVCGKGFRTKRSLREHIMTHTGERPLSCEICGNTFRHHASLYTHKKRVHNVFSKKNKVIIVKED
ncbi:unnamed protein product [Leptosia nina]|uniref:C2H2-type domain-containing protein n=1 Tax=Leptosia nina TaxID=320188 RepID=A0AAV1JXZ3_9NEOP